jgi:hypothetical protein
MRPTQSAIQPVSGSTGYPLVDALRGAGYTIDQRRLERVFRDQKGPLTGHVAITVTPTAIQGVAKGVYHVTIWLQGGQVADCQCDCPDWSQYGRVQGVPCKHILATAVDAPWPLPSGTPALASSPSPQGTTEGEETDAEHGLTAPEPDLTFNQHVRRAIGQAVARLADLVEAILRADQVPFLIGPTDVAKTSAVRLVAVRHGWGFEALDGMSSFADADLVGLRTDHGTYPSAIARAFRRAREGETVLLFLDELTRFNQRALDVLMRPLLPVSAEVARAQRLPVPEGMAVRLVEVPMWGLDWAPAGRCKVVLAANPWGSPLDPALVRRTVPVAADFDLAVAALFQRPARDVIETSWKLVAEAQLPLPIGYTLLAQADDPAGLEFLPVYLAQLRALDRPAAEGFCKILEGMGVAVTGGWP